MGITYHPLNKAAIPNDFDTNIAGADAMAIIYKALGLPIAEKVCGHDRIAFIMDAASAKALGVRISKVPDWVITDLKPIISNKLFTGNAQELLVWVREWQSFLLTCDGYDGT